MTADNKERSITTTQAFYLDDQSRTLFPLKTNSILVTHGEADIRAFIDECLIDDEGHSFLPQLRVYAAKPNLHLRRTVKLDVVAEYYLYDVIFRNRRLFRKPHVKNRSHYGYRFEAGLPINPSAAYKAFKTALAEYSSQNKFSMSFDVASYFNSLYHHDLVDWFNQLGADNTDSKGLSQMLRQINSGRSVDCLPQGIYPAKMIGNDFLRFVENFHGLASKHVVRFMDDIYIFSDSSKDIANDFQTIQRLLGDRGLSVNPQKTKQNTVGHVTIDQEIDEVRRTLLARRRLLITQGYNEAGEEIVDEYLFRHPLSSRELSYVDALLSKSDIEEEDAELILTIMRDHARRVEQRIPDILSKFPHLAKNVYTFCARLPNKEFIADIILAVTRDGDALMEYQLFWMGAMLEDYLMETSKAAAVIANLFNHRSATSLTKAKILEIADTRFGLQDLRNQYLQTGQSEWLGWSSAVGSRKLNSTSRNYMLGYFKNSSPMNRLISKIVAKLPST